MKRTIRSWIVISMATLGVAAISARAVPPATQPTAAPATQPATAPSTQPVADVQALIKQLGDNDFHVRLSAAEQLKALGKTVLPALREASKSANPEIHARAQDIIAELDQPPVDDSAVPQPAPVGANGFRSSFSMASQPGGRVLDIVEPGRSIHIEEKNGSIIMKVTGQLDGKPATREYKADSAEQLKKQHPAAFALYQMRAGRGIGIANIGGAAGNGNVRINIQVNGNVGVGPVAVQVGGNANAPEAMKLRHLQLRLMVAMRTAQVPEAQQKEVLDLVAKLAQAIPDPQKPDKEKDAQKREYERLGDLVRSKAAELKLGDFDALLPPKPEKAAGVPE